MLADLDMFLSCSSMLLRSLLTCPPNSSATNRRSYRTCRSDSLVEPADTEKKKTQRNSWNSHCTFQPNLTLTNYIWLSSVVEVIWLYCCMTSSNSWFWPSNNPAGFPHFKFFNRHFTCCHCLHLTPPTQIKFQHLSCLTLQQSQCSHVSWYLYHFHGLDIDWHSSCCCLFLISWHFNSFQFFNSSPISSAMCII